jgi:HAMP domain-containing protein
MRQTPRRGVFVLGAGFALLATVLPLTAIIPGLLVATRERAELRASEALASAANQAASALVRGIDEQWQELAAMAAFAEKDGTTGSFRLRLDTMKALNDRVTWMGVALSDGRVAVATGGVLEGQDVTARPWFAAGLEGPYAGDVHEAVLLRRLVGPADPAAPFRLIDFAQPLRRPDGTTVGVIASNVGLGWLRDRIRSAATGPGREALLVSRDGMVLVGPAALEGQQLRTRVALAGAHGVALTTDEDWPDGRRYRSAVMPVGVTLGMPAFGWSVILREPAELALATSRAFAVRIVLPLLAVAGCVLTLGLFLAAVLSRRLGALAAAATAIAEGKLEAPVPQLRLTRETAMLSAALARLDRAPPPAAVPAPQERTALPAHAA